MNTNEQLLRINRVTSGRQFDPRMQPPQDFIDDAAELGINQRNSAKILGAVLGHRILDPQQWQKDRLVTKTVASGMQSLPQLDLIKTLVSPLDGFTKLLFRTADGLNIETVIIPLEKPGKATVCLSSQVGCVMGCTFCATARMKDRRNLQTWEIVDQFAQAREVAAAAGLSLSGAVFMGMGEPFLNYQNVMTAAQLLSYPVANAISAGAITISTVGILDKIRRFTAERRPYRLSISIGAATDQKRAKLVPVAAKTSIAEIIAAAREYSIVSQQRIMLAYVCISQENIFVEDAKALAKLVGDTQIRLDLIEVTDTSGLHKRPTETEMNRFRDALNVYLKQPVVRRYSGGADIDAACGTLAGKG